MLTVDFETEAIEGNPTVFPPLPVSVSIKVDDKPSKFYSWGHPGKNNCDGPGKAQAILARHIDAGNDFLFHSAKFELSIMDYHFDLSIPDPMRVYDSMYSVFLTDPYSDTLSLKPSAERLLDWPPEERDRLQEWILKYVDCAASQWGAHIAEAPAKIVKPYCMGDTDRTYALHTKLEVPREAYQREQLLLPILMEAEQRGVRIDVDRLWDDMAYYERSLDSCDHRIRKLLKCDESVNLGSGVQLADAIDRAGMAGTWALTPTGKRSTARANLERAVNHSGLLTLLKYHGALSHCMSNFGRPWLEMVANSPTGERLHPEWNQVRQSRGVHGTKGTRTGRLSSTNPNFQNPPNEYDIKVPKGMPALPVMREYILADAGYVWLKRDYSQQEMRILAHFTEGRLFKRYRKNPRIDAHSEVQALIKKHAHISLERKPVKTTGFGIIYGMGIPALSAKLDVDGTEAAATRTAYFMALPEVKDLMDDCQERGYVNLPIVTWGGRTYYKEPAKMINGHMRSFEYKMLNYLIQGSGADCTKESIIRWAEDSGDGQFLATLHDENNVQAPEGTWKRDMKKLRVAMESIEFDVAMLTDGFVGPSWAKLEACK